MKYNIKTGDVLEETKNLPSNYFSALICDPPYALVGKSKKKGFMGMDWDSSIPSVEVWAELLRVMKPGAYACVFGGSRTHHRLWCNLEDAGFIIRDNVTWLYLSGMPKSTNISKQIDKKLGAEREVIGQKEQHDIRCNNYNNSNKTFMQNITTNATDEAKLWDGYGTALKPAIENICLIQKTLDGTYANNVMTWGCGALNLGACVIGDEEVGTHDCHPGSFAGGWQHKGSIKNYKSHKGRWAANAILDEELGFSRYFYCPKASKLERNLGCEELPIVDPDVRDDVGKGTYTEKGIAPQQNHHPTVKPLDLCRYLATLIMPPKERSIIVPFSGSGSEMIGCMLSGYDEVTGIESQSQYITIAEKRIKAWTNS